MAVITPTLSSLTNQKWGENVAIYTWTGLTTSDTGAPLEAPGFTDASYQVTGTFGGATVTIEGSNDGTNYVTLTDPSATAISFTATGLSQILQIVRFIRPKVTGGSGASINVIAVHCNHMYN